MDVMEGPADLGPARKILEDIGFQVDTRAPEEQLISLLQDLQSRYGYLPRDVLEWVSRQTGISLSRMFGVITFYTQFSLEKKGKHLVRCCQGTACHVKGAPLIADAVKRELGIDAGETTSDGLFSFETVNCLGACALAPLVVIDDEYYGKMDQNKVRKILNETKAQE
jgi:NADH:ubiquinone oxidoreductase subunit E